MPVIQPITSASSGSAYVPTSRTLTINGVTYDLTADRSWTVEVLDNLIATAPLSYNSGTNTISISQSSNTTDGYLSSTDWLTFSSKQNAITLTTTGNNGAATLVGATLNIPEYTLAGLGGMANVFTSLGDMVYSNAAGAPVRRSGNITTTKMFLSQTGDGTSSAAPQWSTVTAADTGAVPTTRQLTINGTSYDLSADRSWSTITSLTGEATASGTGAVSVTLDNNSVIGKVLTGLNTSGGGTIASTDSIVQAFGKVQNQITALVGGVMYEGTWNASTNSPTIVSSTGNKGDYYVVSVAGITTIDGISDWKVGDWIIFNGSTWQKVDNTDLVSSVNGYTGAVVLTTSDVAEGTNLYFTNTRAQNAITLTTTGSSGASTYTSGTLNIPNYSLSGLGGVPTTRTLTINGTAYDLSADRSWSVGTVTSVALSVPTGFAVAGSPITSSGTLALSFASGYSLPTTTKQGEWDTAYNRSATALAYNTSTGVITLTKQDTTTLTATVTLAPFTTTNLTEGTNLYYTDARSRAAISLTTTASSGSSTYNSTTGVLNVPTYTAAGLGAVPTTRTLTINDVAYDLSADRSWSIGDFGTW
jgi:predicted heme/steroid binding protein